jgi:hypothetical protein
MPAADIEENYRLLIGISGVEIVYADSISNYSRNTDAI